MTTINDGGPAFPSPADRTSEGVIASHQEFGMTLRDYFAAKAMAALICEPPWNEGSNAIVTSLVTTTGNAAHRFSIAAYVIADAMLAARGAK